jgi:hypothetical protein
MLLDEDVQDLMHRATADVHAPQAISTAVIATQRRRHRRRAVASVAMTGVTIGAVALVVAPQATSPNTRAAGGVGVGAVRLTAAQKTLLSLSDVAQQTSAGSGRYVAMTERQDDAMRTSVIDSVTGDVWTYQKGAGIPSELPVARHDSLTEAEFAALPTDVAGLRSYLIGQFDDEQRAAIDAMARSGKPGAAFVKQPTFSADDKVFEQATTLLWNPLVGADLRAALFRVLAATPGVQVRQGATDSQGRPAIEISRYDAVNGITDATYESPTTSAVLETSFTEADGTVGRDVYLSVTRSDVLPGNPYAG